MDFYALLDQVLELLQQQGRVSYRALKRQFHLDDEILDDLKEELIYGQRLAVDEDGRVLVWTGGTSIRPAVNPPPPPPRDEPQVDAGRARPCDQPQRMPQRPNAASSRCCSVTWWTRPRSPASSTRKSCARWCGPIKRPAPR